MEALREAGAESVYHYTPLHYLVFIARSKELHCRRTLEARGFHESHLRSKSWKQDIARGFGAYLFLTLDNRPPILHAKLAAGFPHIGIRTPAEHVETHPYALCRFNVAMTRQLKRNGKRGFEESSTNGRYYPGHQIPIARTDEDKRSLLKKHFGAQTMIEVLLDGDLPLPNGTQIICYSDKDTQIATDIITRFSDRWTVVREDAPSYPRRTEYAEAVCDFIDQALADPEWKGNGLDFDRV